MVITQGPFVQVAGVSGCLAIALGSYVAHQKFGMDPLDDSKDLKAVALEAYRMQFAHAIALLTVPFSTNPQITGGLFIAGTLLFSPPTYYYAFTGSRRFINLVPVGGTLLMLGWLTLLAQSDLFNTLSF